MPFTTLYVVAGVPWAVDAEAIKTKREIAGAHTLCVRGVAPAHSPELHKKLV